MRISTATGQSPTKNPLHFQPQSVAIETKLQRWPDAPLVQRTDDYHHFKFKHNRDLDPRNLATMRSLAKAGKFHPWDAPILVDRYFHIIDGQHRFSTCQEFGMPVYYMQTQNDITPEMIMALNQANTKHSVADRMRILSESETVLGDEVRRTLKYWEVNGKPHKISLTLVAQLLFSFGNGLPVGPALLDTTFKVNCERETTQLLNWLIDLAKGPFKYDSKFIAALLTIMRASQDREQVYIRLKNREGEITAEPNLLAYKAMLLEVFNHGRKQKLTLKKQAPRTEAETEATV